MSNIKTLIGYEYKKIFIRKSTWIAFAVAAILTLLSIFAELLGSVYVEGVPIYSRYEEMKVDREYIRALSERKLDHTLISEMQHAYSLVPDDSLYTTTKSTRLMPAPTAQYFNW